MGRTDNSFDRRCAAQMHALAAVRRDIRSHDSAGPHKYVREFTQAFRKYERALTGAELTQLIGEAGILLVGDYHSLAASQRFASALVEQTSTSRQVVLGLEAVLSRDQELVDQWWRREISEQQLRERLRFDREWGYEWSPFYELLAAARDHGEGVYGLDCAPRHDMRRLRSRDRHAAEKIAELRARHPQAVLIVLFGESHLAPGHLPQMLECLLPTERTLTILQNIDALYWRATGESAAAVSVNQNTVCVFNSTPLEKYESYRLCLERWHGEDAPDFTPAVHNLILSLARSLGFRADSPRNGTQPKYLSDSLPEVVQVGEQEFSSSLSREQRAVLEQGGCVYVPENNTVYISEFRLDAAAGEAARFLHCACKGIASSFEQTELERTLVHFGSELLGGVNRIQQPTPGHKLYQAYVEGRVTRAQVRRMFLGKQDSSVHVL